ncbi:MAG: hypothetical protein JWO52_2581 [Gammaproteobacteria bacterium]|jgi:hypothetical protein|nr:hypothetical protein [Gammaproteobacteria bacterium]
MILRGLVHGGSIHARSPKHLEQPSGRLGGAFERSSLIPCYRSPVVASGHSKQCRSIGRSPQDWRR